MGMLPSKGVGGLMSDELETENSDPQSEVGMGKDAEESLAF